MTICQYFLRGKCAFGDRCRNEHPVGMNPKATFNCQIAQRTAAPQKYSGDVGLTPELFVNELRNNMPQWPFTVYSPGKCEPNLIAHTDISFEEMRLLYLMCVNSTGNEQQYTAMVQEKLQHVEAEFKKVLDHPAEAIAYFKSLVQSTASPPSGNIPTANAFAAAQQSSFAALANAHSGPSSVGGGLPAGPFASTLQRSSFAGSSQPLASGFGQAALFGAQPPSGQQSVGFSGGMGVQPFGFNQPQHAAHPSQPPLASEVVVSQPIPEDQLAAYRSQQFSLGKVPEDPPPTELRNIQF